MKPTKIQASLLACIVLVATLTFFQNCSTGSPSDSSGSALAILPPATESNNFLGTYSGTESGTSSGVPFSQNVVLDVTTQTETSISGTFDDGNNNVGTFTGTVVGNTVNPFVATNGPNNPCGAGSFTGSATLQNNSFSATLQGSSAQCGVTVATLAASLVNSAPLGSTAALVLSPLSSSVAPNGSVTFSASGGVAPYTYSIVSGSGTIQASSGVFMASGTAGTTIVEVTDADGTSTLTTISVL